MSSDLSLNGQALLKNNYNHCIKLHFFNLVRISHHRRNYGRAFLILLALVTKFNNVSFAYCHSSF